MAAAASSPSTAATRRRSRSSAGGVPAAVLGVGGAGCADIYGAPSPAAALEEVEAAVADALAEAGVRAAGLAAAAFSLAGADWPEDFALLERELVTRLGLRETPIVVNDALGALRSGSPDWAGVAVVAGTYNAIGARRADGNLFHIGFWPDGAGGRDIAPRRAARRLPRRARPRAADGLVGRALALLRRRRRHRAAARVHAPRRAAARRPGRVRAGRPRRGRRGRPGRLARSSPRRAACSASRRASARRAPGCPSRARASSSPARVLEHPTPLLADAVMAELPGAVAVRHGAPPVLGALLLAFDRIGPARDGDAAALAAALDPERRIRPMGGIALERVTKIFPGGVTAVDDVELEIADGEFMVLVGPSGCGKSTLLRMIAGLEGVSAGTIRIGDRDVTELAPRSRDVAMVFQNYALYPHMRVWDNLAFALRLRRTPKPAMREKVGSVAGVLGLKRADRAQAGRALGRPAPARRDRAGDGARAAGVPHGRAALEPRREAARRDARRARAPARAARHDDGLRHPRPDRGDDARRPRRGAPRRRGAAVRHARAALRRAREPLRRGVHGDARR